VWLTVLLQAALVGIMAPIAPRLCFVAKPLLDEAGNDARLAGPAGAVVLLEWLRGWAFSGFPWLSLGYASSIHARPDGRRCSAFTE